MGGDGQLPGHEGGKAGGGDQAQHDDLAGLETVVRLPAL